MLVGMQHGTDGVLLKSIRKEATCPSSVCIWCCREGSVSSWEGAMQHGEIIVFPQLYASPFSVLISELQKVFILVYIQSCWKCEDMARSMAAVSSTYMWQQREWSGQGKQSVPGRDLGWENTITAAANGSCYGIHLAESHHLCISWGLSTGVADIAAQRELFREYAATKASGCAWIFCWNLAGAVSKPVGGVPRWNCSHRDRALGRGGQTEQYQGVSGGDGLVKSAIPEVDKLAGHNTKMKVCILSAIRQKKGT